MILVCMITHGYAGDPVFRLISAIRVREKEIP